MIDLNGSLSDLKATKNLYIMLFYITHLAGFISRILERSQHRVIAEIASLAAMALAIWFLYQTYRLAKALEYGTAVIIGLIILTLLPVLNLGVVLILVNKYKRTTGASTNFFLFDTIPQTTS